jgi:hypothetical protein
VGRKCEAEMGEQSLLVRQTLSEVRVDGAAGGKPPDCGGPVAMFSA